MKILKIIVFIVTALFLTSCGKSYYKNFTSPNKCRQYDNVWEPPDVSSLELLGYDTGECDLTIYNGSTSSGSDAVGDYVDYFQ